MWKEKKFCNMSMMADALMRTFKSELGAKLKSAGFFNLVIPGGKTPSLFFSMLAEDKEINWNMIRIFWTDERFVAPEDERSNYGMAKKILLDKIHIPNENIISVNTKLKDATTAADEYSDRIQDIFDGRPSFDLIIAGMGPDAHFASLFPNSPALKSAKIAIAVPPPETSEPCVERITLGLSVFNSASKLIFMIQGPNKEKILQRAILGSEDNSIPVSLINKKNDVTWMISE
ncbi:MAG TPA: 6-phosphogluconolactonase [Victivallales bacterium]|nr:6-phosphogluconolactonase [Victivallales bacterium]